MLLLLLLLLLLAVLVIIGQRRAIMYTPKITDSLKMVLLIRSDLGMSKGKVAAQCCHAAVLFLIQLAAYKKAQSTSNGKLLLQKWEDDGQPKITLKCQSDSDLSLYLTKIRLQTKGHFSRTYCLQHSGCWQNPNRLWNTYSVGYWSWYAFVTQVRLI
jgi:peptidyl-tRNA hydrolase